jgi:hypothetical protein
LRKNFIKIISDNKAMNQNETDHQIRQLTWMRTPEESDNHSNPVKRKINPTVNKSFFQRVFKTKIK